MCWICDQLGEWVCWCGSIAVAGRVCRSCGRCEDDGPEDREGVRSLGDVAHADFGVVGMGAERVAHEAVAGWLANGFGEPL